MRLLEHIRARRAERDLLLMAHIVIGFPSLAVSHELVDAMVEAGVDLIELQFPFSEPMADGPVILHANQEALKSGIRVEDCFEFSRAVSARHKIPFLCMSYYNILFRRGLARFTADMQRTGLQGAIVPDCPPEEAEEYLAAMKQHGLAPIFIYSPRTPDERLRALAELGEGFIYVVARKGVTGANTEFSSDLAEYLARCRRATTLPLAVGFGVKSPADIAFLRGKADIAVVGSESLRLLESHGVARVKEFLAGLRG